MLGAGLEGRRRRDFEAESKEHIIELKIKLGSWDTYIWLINNNTVFHCI